MKISMGPVLSLRKSDASEWHVSALIIIDKGTHYPLGIVSSDAAISQPTVLMEHKKEAVLRYDITVARKPHPVNVTYAIGAGTWKFVVPAIGCSPKMAFVSCNGFSDPKAMKNVEEKNALWTHMGTLHKKPDGEYNLLIMGGDQVYADQIWNTAELKKWSDLSRSKRRTRAFSGAMRQQVDDFYFTLYKERWAQTEVASMLSSIPTLMTWDDHDIFDGWGSYSPEDQECKVYQGIFDAAKSHFSVFQLQVNSNLQETRPSTLSNQDALTFAVEADGIAILALDTRSERSQKQVMSAQSWDAVWNWASNLNPASNNSPKHLLIVSPVPVVHADFGSIETTLNWLPGEQELEDDLRDHWQSKPHRKERLRMIHRLFTLMEDKNIRATFLSGDVHCAGLGVVVSNRSNSPGSRASVINQLTSSGIVHPAPPKIMGYLLENLSDTPEEIDQGLSAYMLDFPATRKKFVLSRNFLSLEPDDKDRLWAKWYIEHDLDEPSTKTINPI
ncbi:MAG: alkaline phosphatase D family protein [Sneathiella sp.]